MIITELCHHTFRTVTISLCSCRVTIITCKWRICSKWQLPQCLQIFFIIYYLCSPSVCDAVYRKFVQTAWEDIERFKEQKNKDLHEALISYAIMQISMCKKVFRPILNVGSVKDHYMFSLHSFFFSSGNPGVVQCQGVFQQNVSQFPWTAPPTTASLLHELNTT